MRRPLGVGLLALSTLVGFPAFAATPAQKAACVAAYEQAQQLRSDKKPHAAREKFIACARSECPVVVRKECNEQIGAMVQIAPTVTLEALDDKGATDAAVKVSLDGDVVAQKLDGSAIDVEPGDHIFTFIRASDGKTLDAKVLILEGDKDRKVVADFQTLVPKPPPPPPRAKKEIPVLAYVAGGIGIAGLGSFAAFSLIGRGKESDLASSCSPRCADTQVSPVKRDYAFGDISLLLGVIGLAAGVILALPTLTQSSPTQALAPKPWLPRFRVLE